MSLDKHGIAKRIAQELQDGFYVNLGIGIPTLVANYIPVGINITLHSENGLRSPHPEPVRVQPRAPERLPAGHGQASCGPLG